MLVGFRVSVAHAGSTSNQHWVRISCLLWGGAFISLCCHVRATTPEADWTPRSRETHFLHSCGPCVDGCGIRLWNVAWFWASHLLARLQEIDLNINGHSYDMKYRLKLNSKWNNKEMKCTTYRIYRHILLQHIIKSVISPGTMDCTNDALARILNGIIWWQLPTDYSTVRSAAMLLFNVNNYFAGSPIARKRVCILIRA